MADETVRLVLNVTGVQDVESLKREMLELTKAMGGVDTSLEMLGREAAKVTPKLNELEDAAEKAVGSKDGGGNGRGILQLSWAMQDLFQGGFSAILNNIPGLAAQFGVAAGTAGTLGIAALGIDQAFRMLGPLFADTDKKLKPLAETWKNFAEGLGADKQAVEELENALEKMAGQFRESWTNDISSVTKQFNEFLSLAREARQVQKENDKEQSARKAGEATLDAMADNKDRGGKFSEFLQGQGEDGARGIQEKLAKDELEKARQEYIDELLALRKANGEFGTGRNFSEMKFGFARMEAGKQVTTDNPEVQKRAMDIAAGEMNKASQGDKKALAKIDGADKSFQEYEAEVAADEEAQKIHAKWREKRIEREKREMEENDRQKKLAEVGPPEEAFRRNIVAQREKEEREAQQAIDKKKIEDKVETAKNEALTKARRQNLDKFMQDEGLTPEGLFRQQEAAAARMPNRQMKDRARDDVAQQQAAIMRERMARRGMSEDDINANFRDIRQVGRQRVPEQRGMRSVPPQAEKAVEDGTKEVAQSGDKMVQAVVVNGRVTAQKFRQIEQSLAQLSGMIARDMAGQVGGAGRQFNAGRR